MWREARVAEFKSHDAGLPLPFGESLEMLGQSARFASKCLGVKLGVLEPGAAADLGAHQLSPGHAAHGRKSRRPFSVRDGAGVRARCDDRRLVASCERGTSSRATKRRFGPGRSKSPRAVRAHGGDFDAMTQLAGVAKLA